MKVVNSINKTLIVENIIKSQKYYLPFNYAVKLFFVIIKKLNLRRKIMSVVTCRIYEDKVKMAADTIVVKGWSTVNNAQNKLVKMQKYNGMIIGGCGSAEELSLLFHFIKTHSIKEPDEKSILDFMIEFKRWKTDLIADSSLENSYIIAFKGKAFAFEHMLVMPIDDYYAIGAGEDYANGALCMGATPKQAVKVACQLCAFVAEPILTESLEYNPVTKEWE